MAHDLYRRSLESLGVSQRNEYRLVASLHSICQTHIQDLVLVAMELMYEKIGDCPSVVDHSECGS